MVQSQLRVYHGPQEETQSARTADNAVSVPLGEILPLLADAYVSERTWLRDFENDEIRIPSDLHEVILADQHYRRPSA